MHELCENVYLWLMRWYPHAPPSSGKEKVREESAEVLELAHDDPKLPLELADLILATVSYAIACNIDLATVVDAVLERNNQARWELQPNGVLRRVRDSAGIEA